MTDSYKNKYIKYKNKYMLLKNKLEGELYGGEDDITYHVNCSINKMKGEGINRDVFLNLLLQLLIEYEFMFDIKKDHGQYNTNNFLSINKFLEYESMSIRSLLNTKEQITDTIRIIRDYCNDDIKCRIEQYKKELTDTFLGRY